MKFFKKILFGSGRLRKKKRKQVCEVSGLYHDLKEIYDQINADYFGDQVALPITWFGARSSRPRARLTFGSYNPQSGLIKVHRLLDRPHVPQYFVSYIIYHEILHHLLPPIKEKRRRRVHHREFVERERQFKEYSLAKEFKNLLVKEYW
jgi:hypothetical protein